jgi:hypothetical protein
MWPIYFYLSVYGSWVLGREEPVKKYVMHSAGWEVTLTQYLFIKDRDGSLFIGKYNYYVKHTLHIFINN